MKITRKMHLEIRLQNLFFTLLFLLAVGLLGALSAKYKVEWDWTASHQHTLSESTLKVLALLKSPLKATVYARENLQVRDPIRDLIERYQRQKKDFTLDFVNPDTQPDAVRDNGITTDGAIFSGSRTPVIFGAYKSWRRDWAFSFFLEPWWMPPPSCWALMIPPLPW